MKSSNKKKSGQEGFTLVEVIVVAIIVAALAAVAVPMYTSYVDSSRTNAAANAAGSVASFMGSCINQGATVAGTDIAENTATTGAAATLTCPVGNPQPTMQLPAGLTYLITNFSGTGTVTAEHVDGGDPQVYNY